MGRGGKGRGVDGWMGIDGSVGERKGNIYIYMRDCVCCSQGSALFHISDRKSN